MKREQLIILMIISVMVLSTFVYAGIQASPMIFPDKIVKPVEPSPPPVDMGLPDKDVEPGSGFEPVASCPAVVQPSGDLAPETACAIGVEPDPILEGQSLVHYLKLFNVELVSGSKLEFLKALHENVESKERKVNVVGEINLKDKVLGLENVSIVKFEGKDVEFNGSKVFLAELPYPYKNQSFAIDLSGYNTNYEIGDKQKQESSLRKYVFTLRGAATSEDEDPVYRYLIFDVNSVKGASNTGDKESIMDCSRFWSLEQTKQKVQSIWASIRTRGVTGTLGKGIAAMIGYSAASKASGAAGKYIVTKSTKLALARGFGRLINPVGKITAALTIFGTIASGESTGSYVNIDYKWYDPRQLQSGFFTDKMILDAFISDIDVFCKDKGSPLGKFEIGGNELRMRIIDTDLPNDEINKLPLKIWFVLEPAKYVDTVANSEYYPRIPS